MNKFYARFDTHDYTGKCDELCHSIDFDPVTLVENDVVKCLSRVNPNKAPGPDGSRGRVLKVCADQLGPLFILYFQWLLNIHFVKRYWKMSTIKYYADPLKKKKKKKLVLDNSMTSDQWHSRQSLLSALGDLSAIRSSRLWAIACTPYSSRIEPEGV